MRLFPGLFLHLASPAIPYSPVRVGAVIVSSLSLSEAVRLQPQTSGTDVYPQFQLARHVSHSPSSPSLALSTLLFVRFPTLSSPPNSLEGWVRATTQHTPLSFYPSFPTSLIALSDYLLYFPYTPKTTPGTSKPYVPFLPPTLPHTKAHPSLERISLFTEYHIRNISAIMKFATAILTGIAALMAALPVTDAFFRIPCGGPLLRERSVDRSAFQQNENSHI